MNPSFGDQPQSLPSQALEKNKRLFRRALLFFFVLFLIGGAFWMGYTRGQEQALGVPTKTISPEDAIFINKDNQENTIDFSLFWKVWGILKDKYVDKADLNANTLFYGAIKGMLAATGDPYTTFFSPEENAEFQEDITGTFEGIGAEIGMKDDILTVIAPLEGTPAAAAGILAGDKILKINDETTANLSLDEAVKRIRGKKGTEVKLNIFHPGEEEARDISVRRDMIMVKSVHFEMKEDGIALIRVSRFGDDTASMFKDALGEARKNNAQRVVLDLRNNPGGYLESAVSMGSLMLSQGSVVVLEENAQGERTEMKARAGDMVSGLPTVVLINEGSASASEILAGALKDNRSNVTLVGKKSFGKGSVQELIPLGGNTAVKVTVAHWLTPKGNQINKVGISPDIEVGLSSDDRTNNRDPQLDKALEILRSAN
ncbi:MAG: S41 family peptidase [Candidatus Moraniibacteriota bacterium]